MAEFLNWIYNESLSVCIANGRYSICEYFQIKRNANVAKENILFFRNSVREMLIDGTVVNNVLVQPVEIDYETCLLDRMSYVSHTHSDLTVIHMHKNRTNWFAKKFS